VALGAMPVAAGGIVFEFPVLTWPEPAPAPATRDKATAPVAPALAR